MNCFTTQLGGVLLTIATAAALWAGCGSQAPEPPPCGFECEPLAPAADPIRRITRREYNNTVRDLLGDSTSPADHFPLEEESLGFNNQANSLVATELLADKYMKAAERLARDAVEDIDTLLPCKAASADKTCTQNFIVQFGNQAWRRPLDGNEVARLHALFDWASTKDPTLCESDPKICVVNGTRLVIQAILQSPHFLYRVEFGLAETEQDDAILLAPHEIASRLSYLLWNSMPDEELLAAADADELRTPQQIGQQARRMLLNWRVRDMIANFHTQWLKLDRIDTLKKDAETYPGFADSVRQPLKGETLWFLDHVVLYGAGDVDAMFTAPYSLMNKSVADFYGIANGPSSSQYEVVPLDGEQRSGFLTHAGLLAVLARPAETSPVDRGKFVREQLLCQLLLPPPDNVEIKPPPVDPNKTTRERYQQHFADPQCSVCHQQMDPIGFSFENYDGVGLWRDTENNLPIDATGNLVGTEDIDGEFIGAVELAHKLATSTLVRNCIATQWFRFAYGRAEIEEDAKNIEQLRSAFAASDYNIRELLIALTQTDTFRYRKPLTAKQESPSP